MSLQYELTDGVACITIDRPGRMNALNQETYEALSRAFTEVRDDPAVKTAVLTGAGDRAFCAGADLKETISDFEDPKTFWQTQSNLLFNRGLEIWKPIIAAVNGFCLGGGMTMLMATDVRFSAPHSEYGVPEVKIGALPGNGGTQRILEQLPHAIGMELLLSGRRMTADEALRWGLINEIVPAESLLDKAKEYAAELAALPTLAVQACKEMAIRSRDMDRTVGFRMEMTMLRMLQASPEFKSAKEKFAG